MTLVVLTDPSHLPLSQVDHRAVKVRRAPHLDSHVLALVHKAEGGVAAAVEAAVVLNFAWNKREHLCYQWMAEQMAPLSL